MVFSQFSEMICSLPPDAIITALNLECRIVENEFESDHSSLDDDAFSILCFKQFIQLARKGTVMRCAKHLPAEHLEFYRQTVVRLVQPNELRASALEQFEEAFATS
jgi:hypothetical protein